MVLFFNKTRESNLHFYKWLQTEILIPFVNEIHLNRGRAMDSVAFLQLDGELIKLECYKDDNTIQIL